MEILSYREIDSKDGLTQLLDHAFNWVFNQKEFDDFVKIDSRLKNGPVSFIGVEKGKIIGHVGVMDLATRTIDGDVEYVGGIYGVATLPGHTRRGICKTLMDKAHDYFGGKQYRFSFLSTSPAFVAHCLYEKLGYADLFEYPSAYKVNQEKKTRAARTIKTKRLNLDRLVKIYNLFVEEKTGFVIRDKAHFQTLKKIDGIKPKRCIILSNGYAVLMEDKTRTLIRELVALDQAEMHRLIRMVEDRARGPICDRAVLDSRVLEAYVNCGFTILKRGYGVMMCKPLVSDASFKTTYGDKFYMSRLDAF